MKITLKEHPRAKRGIRRIRGAGGLAGFVISAYLSHKAPRLKIPLALPGEVEEHRRRMTEVERREDRLQAAVDRYYAAFARSLLPKVADYLRATWEYANRPADQPSTP